MNTIKKIYTLGLFFLTIIAYGQTNPDNCELVEKANKIAQNHLVGKIYVDNHLGKRIQYLNDWEVGEVLLENGNVVKDVKIRYNSYTDELLWIRDLDFQAVIVEREKVKEFTFKVSNKTLTKLDIDNQIIISRPDIFVQILTQGKHSIYAYRNIGYHKNKDEFYENDMYFMKTNNKLYKIRLRKKEIFTLFPNDKKEIKRLIRKNNLKVKTEIGFANLINLLNERDQ